MGSEKREIVVVENPPECPLAAWKVVIGSEFQIATNQMRGKSYVRLSNGQPNALREHDCLVLIPGGS